MRHEARLEEGTGQTNGERHLASLLRRLPITKEKEEGIRNLTINKAG